MEDTIKKIDTKNTLTELNKLKHRHGGMPQDRDLQGAAKALIKLRSTYKFELEKFSQGNIHGLQTGAQLSAKDSFFLGKFAFSNGQFTEAQKWLEFTAWQLAAAESIQNSTAAVSSVTSDQVDQMMKNVGEKLKNTHPAPAPSQDLAEDDDPSNYEIGIIPPKTNDRAKMITTTDRRNFDALCRGLQLLPAEKSKHLKCYYQRQHSDSYGNPVAPNPYFMLHPLKVEVSHEYPHRILTIHDVLSDKEADSLAALALPRMRQASVGHGKEVSEGRVSRNCWLKDFESSIVDKISARINWITGLQTTRPLDVHKEGKVEEYEPLQVANYGIGGFYECHQDPMFVYKEPDFLVHSVEADPPYVTGDRLGTFMMYLSEVPLGGWTAFPRLGVAVQPRKGSAVYWHNLKRSGRSDMHMLHGGCPVILGSKWVANKWIREFANAFHNKCVDNINN